MHVELNDPTGRVRAYVETAGDPDAAAHENPVMRAIAASMADQGETGDTALIDALRGYDDEAVALARGETRSGSHRAFALGLLARTCGGIDPDVALAVSTWLDDASITGEDGSSVAWYDGHLTIGVPRPDGGPTLVSTEGWIALDETFPETVVAAMAGRPVADVIGPDLLPAGLVVRSASRGPDGETVVHVAGDGRAIGRGE